MKLYHIKYIYKKYLTNINAFRKCTLDVAQSRVGFLTVYFVYIEGSLTTAVNTHIDAQCVVWFTDHCG